MTRLQKHINSINYAESVALLATIHADIDEVIQRGIQAELARDNYIERHGIENSPELYGRECSRLPIYSVAGKLGGDCNPEASEVENGLLASVTAAGNAPEKN
jgi:hypothetical protein